MGGVSELSYPILYEAAETDFRTMGISVLVDAVSLLVTEERNGRFELTMEYPVDSEQFKELRNDRIIKADASPELLDQRFKIIRITKPIRGLVTIYAEHSSYLSRDLALKPSVNYSGSAQIALNTWSNNIVDEHPFEVYSDIVLDKSGAWTIDKVENARKALGGVSGSILDSYGGEYQFDNYAIRLYQNRGVDNGALIAYGKNLTDLTQEEEIDRTYTSVYPYSTLTDDDGNSTVITLPEYFIDSENVANFARRKILVVNFTDEEITDVDTLRNRTISYISQNGIGLPKVNLKVSFIDLSKTLDHKNMAAIEKIGLCDWVTIYFEKYDIYKKSKVIKTVYNPLIEQYDSIEIGETRASLTQTIESNISNQIKPVRDQLAIVQLQANGKNKTYTQTAEPNNYEDYLVGDSWVRPIGENDRELYHWNGTNWQFLLSTLKTREAEQAITEQQAALEEVKTTADYSYDQIQQTIANSEFTDLDTAFANVKTLSEQAESNAQAALSSASNAVGIAEGASTLATTLSGQVSDFELTVNGFNQTVNNYEDQVAQFSTDVNGLNSTVASYETQVDEFGNTVGTYATQVSQFENTVDGLNSTVSKYQSDVQGYESQVSTLTNTVSGFNATVQRVEGDYNGLSGTVQTLGASIGVVEGQITNKVWKTDIQGAIDEIEIGGRNLFQQSNLRNWADASNSIRESSNWRSFFAKVNPDQTYSLSRSSLSNNRFRYYLLTEEPYVGMSLFGLDNYHDSDLKIEGFKTNSDTEYILVYLTNQDDDLPDIKLEKGNKATDWTPAPEDTTELISSIQTEWTQTFNTFEQSVTGSDGRLTLAEQFLDGFRNTAFDPSTGQLSLTEQTINGLQETVSDPVNGLETRVTTIANGFQVLSNDVDGLEAQLSVTNENVLARVQKGDVYSQLLIDSRNILFDANDRIMLSANKVVIDASEGTFISGAVIENASIDTAKIADLAVTSAKIINLDVDKISGNRTNFVQSAWNDIGAGVTIDSNGFNSTKTTAGITNEIKLTDGQMVLNSNASGVPTEVLLDGQGLEFTTSGQSARMRFNGTNIVFDGGNLGMNRNHINSVDWIRIIGQEGETMDTSIFNSPNHPGSIISDTRQISIGLGSQEGVSRIASFGGDVQFMRNLLMNSNVISGVHAISFNGSSTILTSSIGHLGGGALIDGTAITIGLRTSTDGRGHDRVAEFYGQIHFYRNLYMNGKNVVDTSDERKKELITPTKQNSLEMIKALEYKNFYWKDKTISPNKQFGLIAQEVDPTLVHYNEQKDEYGIKQNRLIHAIGHGLQQLALDHENAVSLASKAYLKAESNDERIESLEAELKLLKGEQE